jgi:hypothetical protein
MSYLLNFPRMRHKDGFMGSVRGFRSNSAVGHVKFLLLDRSYMFCEMNFQLINSKQLRIMTSRVAPLKQGIVQGTKLQLRNLFFK